MNRRRFLKYAGATAAVVGASALVLDFLLSPKPKSQILTSTTTSTTSTIPVAPPTIGNFKWQPTRSVNGRVYDATVSFDVESTEPVNSVNGILEGYAPTIPPRAYPPENPVTLQLGSLATSASVTTYSAKVGNLKGGKQYKLSAQAKNSAGAQTAEFETPYVREFENISGQDDILVIADYYTWYEKTQDPGPHWYHDRVRTHIFDPILGEYASGDEAVISKHIDWATGHGIDAFLVSWWSTGTDERTWDYHLARNLEAALKNPLIDDIRFAILYENNGRLRTSNPDDRSAKWVQDLNDPFNRQRLVSDFEFLAENYFGHPSYLGIKDRPVVRFDYTIPFRGDVVGVFAEVRAALEKNGFGIYLINDLMGRSISPYATNDFGANESHFREITEAFDAIGASNFPGAYDDITKYAQHVENVYKAWREYAKTHGKDFIPAVWPGHQGAPPLYKSPYVPLARSTERLRRQIKLAKQYSTLKMISVISFNEWIAGHQVEPSKEEGFAYLETIRDNLQERS